MKATLPALLFAAFLIAFAAQAKADDRDRDDDRRYYRRHQSSEQCEPRRYYERPTYYYQRPRYDHCDEAVVIRSRRHVIREDDGCRPSYRRHGHHLSFRSFFGGR